MVPAQRHVYPIPYRYSYKRIQNINNHLDKTDLWKINIP